MQREVPRRKKSTLWVFFLLQLPTEGRLDETSASEVDPLEVEQISDCSWNSTFCSSGTGLETFKNRFGHPEMGRLLLLIVLKDWSLSWVKLCLVGLLEIIVVVMERILLQSSDWHLSWCSLCSWMIRDLRRDVQQFATLGGLFRMDFRNANRLLEVPFCYGIYASVLPKLLPTTTTGVLHC